MPRNVISVFACVFVYTQKKGFYLVLELLKILEVFGISVLRRYHSKIQLPFSNILFNLKIVMFPIFIITYYDFISSPVHTLPEPTAPIIAHSFPLRMRKDMFFSAKKLGSPVQLADTSWTSTTVSLDVERLRRNFLLMEPTYQKTQS